MAGGSTRLTGETTQARLTGKPQTTLVNVKQHGKKGVKMIGRSTKYGSPFKLEKDGGNYEREESVDAFSDHWYSEECDDLREMAIEELMGETLGCYCVDEPKTEVEGKPDTCHGEVILRFLNRVAVGDTPTP